MKPNPAIYDGIDFHVLVIESNLLSSEDVGISGLNSEVVECFRNL